MTLIHKILEQVGLHYDSKKAAAVAKKYSWFMGETALLNEIKSYYQEH